MEDSQFCIDDDIEGNFHIFLYKYLFYLILFLETPKNSPARVTVSESTTVDLGKFSQSSSSLVNDHLSFHVNVHLILHLKIAIWN